MEGSKCCPECSDKLDKIIYAGLPGRFCPSCGLMLGLATLMAQLTFNGLLFVYEGSYWKALWFWLFNGPDDI